MILLEETLPNMEVTYLEIDILHHFSYANVYCERTKRDENKNEYRWSDAKYSKIEIFLHIKHSRRKSDARYLFQGL